MHYSLKRYFLLHHGFQQDCVLLQEYGTAGFLSNYPELC